MVLASERAAAKLTTARQPQPTVVPATVGHLLLAQRRPSVDSHDGCETAVRLIIGIAVVRQILRETGMEAYII